MAFTLMLPFWSGLLEFIFFLSLKRKTKAEEGQAWVVAVPHLPFCSSFGLFLVSG